MPDICTLHTLWFVAQKEKGVTEHHLKTRRFERVLRTMCSERADNMYSTWNVVVPFTVETAIDLEPLFWSASGTTVLFVDVKSATIRYSDNAHRKEFSALSGVLLDTIDLFSKSFYFDMKLFCSLYRLHAFLKVSNSTRLRTLFQIKGTFGKMNVKR